MTPRLLRIVPLVRMPRSLGFFDYLLPEGMDAGIGSFVRIPFRGRPVPGVVVDCPASSDVPKARMKPIEGILDAPRLSAPVIEVLLAIAETSLTSPATTLRALLPTVPKRPLSLPEAPRDSTRLASEATAKPLWKDAFREGDSLFTFDTDADRTAFLDAALRHARTTGGPLLFIAPRIAPARAFAHRFGAHATLVTGRGAMTARWRAWREAERASVVAGTALALFTPHKRPSMIVVDEEGASEHLHGDAAPRFDVRDAAERLGHAWGCPVIFLSQTPRVDTWHRLGTSLRHIPATHTLDVRTVICDFGDEFRSRRFNPVTASFLMGLDEALSADRSAVIIVNRKGDAARLVCRDCKAVSSCPSCRMPYAVHGSALVCPRCQGTMPVPDLCPSCGSARLAGSGAGIGRIAEFLAARYPERRIAAYTKEAHESSAFDADILLGTEYLMTHGRERIAGLPSIGFVGTLSADTFLVRLSDALATAREYRRLRRLALTAAAHGRPLFIQTSEPELPLYAMLAAPPERWYSQELEDRKTAHIYPYSAMARLSTTGTDHAKLRAEAETLAAALQKTEGVTVFESRIIRSGSRSKAWVGLACAPDHRSEMRSAVLRALPESWGYDPAPYEPIT